MDIWNTIFVYFVVVNLHLSTADAAEIQSLNIISIPMTALLGYWIVKIGPKKIYEFSYLLIILASLGWLAIWYYAPQPLLLYLILNGLLYQIGRAGMVYVPWNIFSFIPDIDEVMTDQKRAGSFTSVMTFIRKSSSSIATMIVGILLDASGYVSKTSQQTSQVETTIALIVSVLVILFIFLAFLIVRRFQLSYANHEVVVAEIKRKQAGGLPEEAPLAVRQVIQELSGQPYPKKS